MIEKAGYGAGLSDGDMCPASALLFSVVIPLYNSAHTLPRCLNSVLRQTCDSYEIVVVDDGSTDDGAEIAQKMIGPKGRVLRQPNSGVSAARNRGILEARGQLIAFLDADDDWERGYLDAIRQLRDQYPEAGLLATGYRKCYETGPAVEVTAPVGNGGCGILIADYFARASCEQIVWTGAATVPLDVLQDIGMFADHASHGEDLDLWAKIAVRYPVAYQANVLSNYRVPRRLVANRYSQRPAKLEITRSMAPFLSGVSSSRYSASREGRMEIKKYLRNVVADAAHMVFRTGHWQEVAVLFNENDGSALCPVLTRMSARPGLSLILRLYLHVGAKLQSRLVLRLTGGVRYRGGTVVRLCSRIAS